MATNKNQHFVPRCYLKAFTHNSENKTINVYNVDRRISIPLAPVKNQCSRDYFYGKDPKLEDAIQFVERAYASILRDIVHNPRSLNEYHWTVIKRFWLLQYLRTEAASKRTVEMTSGLADIAQVKGKEFNLGIKEAVLIAMDLYVKNMEIVDDLKVCLVLNKTELPFITSDDPAILTNRWHLNDERTKFRSFGLGTAGDLLLLPITPNIMFVAYDCDVYSIPHQDGWTTISQKRDVEAFNQHQLLNCRLNFFFKSIQHHEFIDTSFKSVAEIKPPARHRINYAIFDYQEGEYTRYKVVDYKTAEHHEKAIIHTETLHYNPSLWPSIIQWRNKGVVYTNGTGAGYLRKNCIPYEYNDFHKEPLRSKK